MTQKTRISGGGDPIDIFKTNGPIDMKFFWGRLIRILNLEKNLGPIRIFYGRRIFYEYRTFCKIGYFRHFEAIFTKHERFLGQCLAILRVKNAKICFFN